MIVEGRANSGSGGMIADIETEETTEVVQLSCTADGGETRSDVKVHLVHAGKAAKYMTHAALNRGDENGADDALLNDVERTEAEIFWVVDRILATFLHEVLPGGIVCTIGQESVFITDLC